MMGRVREGWREGGVKEGIFAPQQFSKVGANDHDHHHHHHYKLTAYRE